ncbi:MAG: class I SAM-dependent methyltransferase [Promethearchaeota archaeon]
MDDYYETNKRRWDELVAIHAQSEEYDLKGFLEGKSSLHQVELDALGDVSGKTLLHLQCHFGLDTISWTRLGATATGVDFSDTAIELAQELAKLVGADTQFICSNLYDLPKIHQKQYDIVFTSFGVLCWLADITGWAEVVAHFLKPRGTFLIVEGHPFFWVFDNDHPTDLKIKYSYWHSDEPLSYDEPGTYIDTDMKLINTKSYEWAHTVSDILNAIIQAGLVISEVYEFPHLPWKPIPFAKKHQDGEWRLDGDLLPLSWSIKAVKPGK